MKDFVLDLYVPLDPTDKTGRLNKKNFDSYNECRVNKAIYEVTKAIKTIMCKRNNESRFRSPLYDLVFVYC